MLKRFSAPRKGVTLVETIAAVIIMVLAVIVMGRLTDARLQDTKALDLQIAIQAADSYMSAIYHDFHNCESFTIDPPAPTISDDPTEDDLTNQSYELIFEMGGEYGTVIYQFISGTDLHSESGYGACYRDGIKEFTCAGFQAIGTKEHLYLMVRLPNEKRLEMDIYR